MGLPTHPFAGYASKLPISTSYPVLSFCPVGVPSSNRRAPMFVRVSAPATGTQLPVIILSHGHGPSNHLASYNGYAPVAGFLASHGFVVIQPTHLNSRYYSDLQPSAGDEMFYKSRPGDVVAIIDHLDKIEAAVPTLQGRIAKSSIGLVGHSFGAMTTSLLLGSTNTDPRDGTIFNAQEPRIKAGIMLGGLGKYDGLTDAGKIKVPFYDMDYSSVATPMLVICGDEDGHESFTFRGASWHSDPYTASSGQKDLMWVKGGKHGFGGISGWDAAEGDDSNPERLEFVLRMVWAYMMAQLAGVNEAWTKAKTVLADLPSLGSIESKGY